MLRERMTEKSKNPDSVRCCCWAFLCLLCQFFLAIIIGTRQLLLYERVTNDLLALFTRSLLLACEVFTLTLGQFPCKILRFHLNFHIIHIHHYPARNYFTLFCNFELFKCQISIKFVAASLRIRLVSLVNRFRFFLLEFDDGLKCPSTY